jgi:hypothetical protein
MRGHCAAEKRTDLVHYLDGGVYDNHATEGDTRYEEKARD